VLEAEKKWLDWIDLELNELSKSQKITATTILKLDNNTPSEVAIYALQYYISDQNTLQEFLKTEDQSLKKQIKTQFGDAVLHFSSQLEIIKEY
jgi:hypothetical protein